MLYQRALQRFNILNNRTLVIYVLPKLDLKVAGVNYSKNRVPIHIESRFVGDEYGEGALGADFLFHFNKVTLNFDKMFVKAEE